MPKKIGLAIAWHQLVKRAFRSENFLLDFFSKNFDRSKFELSTTSPNLSFLRPSVPEI